MSMIIVVINIYEKGDLKCFRSPSNIVQEGLEGRISLRIEASTYVRSLRHDDLRGEVICKEPKERICELWNIMDGRAEVFTKR